MVVSCEKEWMRGRMFRRTFFALGLCGLGCCLLRQGSRCSPARRRDDLLLRESGQVLQRTTGHFQRITGQCYREQPNWWTVGQMYTALGLE